MSSISCWPDDAAFAISLTYDGGHPSHLKHAIPQLEAAGYRGSFYPDIACEAFMRNLVDWREVHRQGHEIGSQSPGVLDCLAGAAASGQVRRIIRDAARRLNDHIGQDSERSFAHPIEVALDDGAAAYDAYRQAVREHHFAARGGGDRINRFDDTDLLHIASYTIEPPSLEAMLAACRNAQADGGWVVFRFLALGEVAPSDIRPAVHASLLQHLTDLPCWVAPLKCVARHVQRNREQTACA